MMISGSNTGSKRKGLHARAVDGSLSLTFAFDNPIEFWQDYYDCIGILFASGPYNLWYAKDVDWGTPGPDNLLL